MAAFVFWQSRLVQEASLDALHFGNVGVFGLLLDDRVEVQAWLQRVQLRFETNPNGQLVSQSAFEKLCLPRERFTYLEGHFDPAQVLGVVAVVGEH